MKIHAIVLALLFPVSASAVHHHEFGTIKEEGGTVSHTFVLPAASSPQTILHAFPGCPCVKVDYPRQTVKAGEPINVTVIFDPEKQKGHFTKSVYLRLNDNRRDTLVITGTIERTRPLIDISGYPAEFGYGLRLDRKVIDFGAMSAGSTKTLTIPMLNSYEAGMRLDLHPSGADSTLVTIPYGLMIGPGGKSSVQVTMTIPAKSSARRVTDVYLIPTINGVEVDSIPVRAVIR